MLSFNLTEISTSRIIMNCASDGILLTNFLLLDDVSDMNLHSSG